jgi:hypothetical protein
MIAFILMSEPVAPSGIVLEKHDCHKEDAAI